MTIAAHCSTLLHRRHATKRALCIALALITLAALAADPTEEAYASAAWIRANITYELAAGRPIRSPALTIQQRRGNCFEQALVLLQAVYLDHPKARLEIRVYYGGGETVSHATAVVNGVEFDLTGALAQSTYTHYRLYSFLEAWDLYVKEALVMDQYGPITYLPAKGASH